MVDNELFGVAISGHYMEELYAKGHFFRAHFYALAPPLGQRFELIMHNSYKNGVNLVPLTRNPGGGATR